MGVHIYIYTGSNIELWLVREYSKQIQQLNITLRISNKQKLENKTH